MRKSLRVIFVNSPITNDPNSFNTNNKSMRKSENVSFSFEKLRSLRISQVLLGGPLGKLGDPNFQSECPMDYWGITRDPPGDPKQDAHTRHLAISGQTLPGQPGNFPYPINVFSNYNPGFFCSTWARISNQANIFLKHTVCIFVEVRAGMICCKHLVCFLC